MAKRRSRTRRRRRKRTRRKGRKGKKSRRRKGGSVVGALKTALLPFLLCCLFTFVIFNCCLNCIFCKN